MPLPRFRLAALFPPKYALSVFRQGLFFWVNPTPFCDSSAIFVTLGATGSTKSNKAQKKPPEQHVPVVFMDALQPGGLC